MTKKEYNLLVPGDYICFSGATLNLWRTLINYGGFTQAVKDNHPLLIIETKTTGTVIRHCVYSVRDDEAPMINWLCPSTENLLCSLRKM